MSDTVILTSYFSQKIHPNDPNDNCVIGRDSDGRVWQNSFEYIRIWYESIKNLGVEARIFYDNLSDDFISKFSNNNIKFIKVNVSSFSNNDWRFFCYRDYLNNNYHSNIFLTDCSDVKVVKNPEQIILEHPDTNYFICKDSISIGQFGYLKVHEYFKWNNIELFKNHNLDLLNMGVIGAKYHDMLNFLDKFCVVRLKMQNPEFNADMWIGQYVFRHLLNNKKIITGYPFTSDFKKYQNDREDVYFIHK